MWKRYRFVRGGASANNAHMFKRRSPDFRLALVLAVIGLAVAIASLAAAQPMLQAF